MNSIKHVLEVLTSVGIDEVVFEPTDSGGTKLRGANKDQNIIVFDTIDENITDHPMGVQSVKGLLSRIQLFDDSKASIEFEDNDELITDIKVKQGRKKVSYRCAAPSNVLAPKRVPGDFDSDDRIELEKEYTDYISQAISSMSYTGDKAERTISIGVEDNSATFNIFDGEDDSFSDVKTVDYPDSDKAYWEVVPFQRVMKQSVEQSTEGKASFFITEHGIAVFSVSNLKIIVAPVH